MRFVFIPGLGEEVSIFEKLHPLLKGEKIFVENWELLREVPGEGLSAYSYAEFLIERFGINRNDVIIGHSMGGWIALQIKQIIGCLIIQISSMTNLKKVPFYSFPNQGKYKLAKLGWGFNELSLQVLLALYYKGKPSEKVFKSIFERLRVGNKEIVAKQLMVVFNPIPKPTTVSPNLRIHAKQDHIVRPPDELYYQVPGDHFALWTYPKHVANPINLILHLDN